MYNQKFNFKVLISHSSLRHLPKRNESTHLHRDLCVTIHNNLFHRIQYLEQPNKH
jgi:hypothetical protein